MNAAEQETGKIRASDEPGNGAGYPRGSTDYRALASETAGDPGDTDHLRGANGHVVVVPGVSARNHRQSVGTPAYVDDPMGDQLPIARKYDNFAQPQVFNARRLHPNRFARP